MSKTKKPRFRRGDFSFSFIKNQPAYRVKKKKKLFFIATDILIFLGTLYHNGTFHSE